MLKKLKKNKMEIYWIDSSGTKHDGCPSWLSGDVSGLSGDVSGLSGDVSGLSGDVSEIRGNVDDCKISNEERIRGIDISDLIGDD